MLADRDNSLPDVYLSELESRSAGHLRFLTRLHVENYFLDENTIATAFEDLAAPSDWRRQPAAIRERLLNLAQACIPVAVNRWLSTQLRSLVGELDISAKGIDTCSQDQLISFAITAAENETARISQHLGPDALSAQLSARWTQLAASLNSGDRWKSIFPGKMLFGQFAAACRIKSGMLRSAYLAASRRTNFAAFQDILDIFAHWAQ